MGPRTAPIILDWVVLRGVVIYRLTKRLNDKVKMVKIRKTMTEGDVINIPVERTACSLRNRFFLVFYGYFSIFYKPQSFLWVLRMFSQLRGSDTKAGSFIYICIASVHNCNNKIIRTSPRFTLIYI